MRRSRLLVAAGLVAVAAVGGVLLLVPDDPAPAPGPQAAVGTRIDRSSLLGLDGLSLSRVEVALASGSRCAFSVDVTAALAPDLAERLDVPRTVDGGVWAVVDLDPDLGFTPASGVAVELIGGTRPDRPVVSVVAGDTRVELPRTWKGQQLVALPDSGDARLEVEDGGLVQQVDLADGTAAPYDDFPFDNSGAVELDCPSQDDYGPAGPGERVSEPGFEFEATCRAYRLGHTPYAAGVGWHPDGGSWTAYLVRFSYEIAAIPRRSGSATFTIGGEVVGRDLGQVVRREGGRSYRLYLDDEELADGSLLEIERTIDFARREGDRPVRVTRQVQVELS